MPHTISGQATRDRRIGGVVRAIVAFFAAAATLSAQSAPMLPAETLLDRAVLKALDEELSGVAAKDHVARLTQLHRVPASPGFHDAIDYVSNDPPSSRRRAAITWRPCRITARRCCGSPMRTRTSGWQKMDGARSRWRPAAAATTPPTSWRRRCYGSSDGCAPCRASWVVVLDHYRFVTLDADLHVGSEYVERLGAGLGDAVKGILAEAAPHVPPDA